MSADFPYLAMISSDLPEWSHVETERHGLSLGLRDSLGRFSPSTTEQKLIVLLLSRHTTSE